MISFIRFEPYIRNANCRLESEQYSQRQTDMHDNLPSEFSIETSVESICVNFFQFKRVYDPKRKVEY